MQLTATDLVEGRFGVSLLIGLLAFAVIANVAVKPPASVLPASLALGGAVVLLVQNTLLLVSRQFGEEDAGTVDTA